MLGKLEPQPPLAPPAPEPINSVSAPLPSHLQVLFNESCDSLGDHERLARLLRSYKQKAADQQVQQSLDTGVAQSSNKPNKQLGCTNR